MSLIVVADTCAVIAAYDETHPEGEACSKVLDSAAVVIFSPLVLDEVDHIARGEFGYEASCVIADEIRGHVASQRYVVPEITSEILGQAGYLRKRYAAQRLDLSDAVTMALANQYATDAILTLDRRDFRAVSPLSSHPAFRLLPDDL
ncbi:type II toxin-antitoxin system VapC family toxin [Streptomyces sp. NPDC001709]